MKDLKGIGIAPLEKLNLKFNKCVKLLKKQKISKNLNKNLILVKLLFNISAILNGRQ